MVVISSLLALVFGLSLGLFFENILVLIGVTLVIPCLFWSFRIFHRHGQHTEAIHSNSLPASVFKSEFDDVEFTDDRRRSIRKKTFTTSISYFAGVLIGGVIAPVVLANL